MTTHHKVYQHRQQSGVHTSPQPAISQGLLLVSESLFLHGMNKYGPPAFHPTGKTASFILIRHWQYCSIDPPEGVACRQLAPTAILGTTSCLTLHHTQANTILPVRWGQRAEAFHITEVLTCW